MPNISFTPRKTAQKNILCWSAAAENVSTTFGGLKKVLDTPEVGFLDSEELTRVNSVKLLGILELLGLESS